MLLRSQLRVRADVTGLPDLASCVDMGEVLCLAERGMGSTTMPDTEVVVRRCGVSSASLPGPMAVCGGPPFGCSGLGRSCNKTLCVGRCKTANLSPPFPFWTVDRTLSINNLR